MAVNHKRKRCRPFLYCNLPTNVVHYIGVQGIIITNTTDTFRRSKRICLRHSLTFCQNMWDNKAAQIKGDKQFSWHLNAIYQHAFKHTKIFIGISRPFKESLWYTPTCHIRQLKSVDIVTTGQLPSSEKNWNWPMQNIVRRARTLNQWFENQQSKKFKACSSVRKGHDWP